MEKINLNEYLAANEYPGRGIAVAKAPDGRQMFIGYFIMGRSENSRNRVFDPVPERGGQRGLRRMSRMRNELLGTMCRPGTGMHQGLRVTCCGSSLSRMK